MSLDPYLRCTGIRDGRAKPHPFPDRFMWDESKAPSPSGDPTEQEWEAHDRWVQESSELEGFLVSEELDNITRAQHVREFLRGLQGDPGPKVPDSTKEGCVRRHAHWRLDPCQTVACSVAQEVNLVLASSDILTPEEKEFFESMRRLCQAGISTGNPIVF